MKYRTIVADPGGDPMRFAFRRASRRTPVQYAIEGKQGCAAIADALVAIDGGHA